ncbi:MAG: methylmalonyl Co-A mutase-associated GTPase MeaB [Microthrixaceae bacterium]
MFAEALDGDKLALARLLTIVERGGDRATEVSALTWARPGGAELIGLTGAPGAGKSTLTNALCSELRSRDRTVGVLAIDPTSPYSGGAILGDRVRMTDHAGDDSVFVRSMATRGQLGGLTVATPEAVRVLDAVGFDTVVVETVGVGQVEVDIARTADTTVVVVNPRWGDSVQTAKAGLMEVADIFVVNKADRDGAAQTRRDLESMVSMASDRSWTPPVVSTVATEREGVEELADALAAHRRHLVESGELERRRTARVRDELLGVLRAELVERAGALADGPRWEAALADLLERRTDPWSAARGLLGGD